MEVSVVPDVFHPMPVETFTSQPSVARKVTSLDLPPPALPSGELAPSPLKQGQGGIRRVCRTEEATPSPFPDLPAGVLEMRVKEGSKIHNLMGFALARVQGEQGTGGGVRQLVFVGSGRAVTKTITCAEILKRRVEGLHQLTKVQHKMVHEVWEGGEDGAAKAGVTVHRTVPAISILLSKDPLDPQEPGYQPPLAPGAGRAPPSKREDENRDITQPASKRLPDALPYQPSSKKPHLQAGLQLTDTPFGPAAHLGENWH